MEGEKPPVFKSFGKAGVAAADRGYGNRAGVEYLSRIGLFL
jgi:hypothetical protein